MSSSLTSVAELVATAESALAMSSIPATMTTTTMNPHRFPNSAEKWPKICRSDARREFPGPQFPNSLPVSSDRKKLMLALAVCLFLQALTPCKSAMETSLLADVSRALETLRTTMNLGEDSWPKCSTGMTPPPAEHLRRGVMRHLRAAGHDAAICKSRWNHTGGFPGGASFRILTTFFMNILASSQQTLAELSRRS